MSRIWNDKIKMELEHRDIVIFEQSLSCLKKQISKSARLERQNFGAGAFTELEKYIEHLERRIGAAYDYETTISVQD